MICFVSSFWSNPLNELFGKGCVYPYFGIECVYLHPESSVSLYFLNPRISIVLYIYFDIELTLLKDLALYASCFL